MMLQGQLCGPASEEHLQVFHAILFMPYYQNQFVISHAAHRFDRFNAGDTIIYTSA
jgi:hypothetical protein